MRIVGLFDLTSGAWVAMARGTLKGSKKGSERTLWLRLWRHLKPGDTVVADAASAAGLPSLFSSAGASVW